MKELIIAAVILIIGFTAGQVMIQMLNHPIEEPTPIVHRQIHKPIYSIVCDWPHCYEKETTDANISVDMERNVR